VKSNEAAGVQSFADIEWKLMSDLIESRIGLAFDDSRREILEARLQPRLEALHLQTFSEYYRYLRFHPDRDREFAEVTRHVTNGETYFFREQHHFEILRDHVLERVLERRNGRPLRILSAGCSSGQEAYSIAMVLHEAAAGLPLWGWEIHACDINSDRLEQAWVATYRDSSFRMCDDEFRKRYFQEVENGYKVKPPYRVGVRFFEANLAGRCSPNWPTYDVIFCRNVLIYFSDSAFRSAVDRFYNHLVPGGYLFLGHSESLINKCTDFKPVCIGGKIVYHKEEEPSSDCS
jgi:chemotaxis protein methyltransferase CheR